MTFCGATTAWAGAGAHLARERLAEDGATRSRVAGGRPPATAFAHGSQPSRGARGIRLAGGRRAVPGRRAGPRRGGDRGAVPGDRPRHGVPVRARPAHHVDRDAARGKPRGRPRDGVRDLLRLHALPFGLHHRRPAHRGDLRRFAHDQFQPGHVRVATRGVHGAPPRAARPGRVRRRCARLRRRAGCRGWRGSSVRTSPPCARWRRCWPTGSAFRRRCRTCSPTSWSAGTARARSARAKGEEIPLPMRIVHVAVGRRLPAHAGRRGARRARRARARGACLDPEVAACLADNAPEILALDERGVGVGRDARRRAAPPADRSRAKRSIAALAAMGDFADLISPYLTGHSAGVAELAERGGAALPHRRRRNGAPARGARPRPRAGCGRRPHLAEARAAERRRVGAGAPPPVPHRARPLPLARSWPRSRPLPAPTTSASTAPATTAGPPAPSSPCPPGCSPPPTPTRR